MDVARYLTEILANAKLYYYNYFKALCFVLLNVSHRLNRIVCKACMYKCDKEVVDYFIICVLCRIVK